MLRVERQRPGLRAVPHGRLAAILDDSVGEQSRAILGHRDGQIPVRAKPAQAGALRLVENQRVGKPRDGGGAEECQRETLDWWSVCFIHILEALTQLFRSLSRFV
jgi:hypothetical protein